MALINNPHPLADPASVSSREEAMRGLRQLPKDAILEFDCHKLQSRQFHTVIVRYNSVDITNLIALAIGAQLHSGAITADVKDIEERLRNIGIVWLQSILIRV